jgi:hypothetical protein
MNEGGLPQNEVGYEYAALIDELQVNTASGK